MPIKKLIEDVTNTYISVAGQNFYFCSLEKRKPYEGMIEITLGDLGLKINELIELVNHLEEKCQNRDQK